MAQRIQTLLIDDIDGGEADGSVRFGLDGTDYEIDLSTAHTTALRKALEKYIGAGRRVGGPGRRAGRGSGRRTADSGPNPSEVREWAKAEGIEVKDRGRVPTELVVRFKAATGA
jgi:Lsr2